MYELILSRFKVRITHRQELSVRILNIRIYDVPGYLRWYLQFDNISLTPWSWVLLDRPPVA
jgi:hypothetical protein